MTNYLNSFNLSATIQYTMLHDQHVKLEVYDKLGKDIATLLDIYQEAGNYSITFNAG